MEKQIRNKMLVDTVKDAGKRLLTPLIAVLLAAGCVPEETVRWNDAGTVGVYSSDSGVGLIDEVNNRLVLIEEGEISPWADISRDGTMICYVIAREFAEFEAARPVLPPETLAAIETAGAQVLQRLDAGASPEESLQLVEGGDALQEWVKKYVWDGWKDKYSLPESAKVETVELSELVLCSAANLQQKEALVRSIEPLGFGQFSPDGSKLGYVQLHKDITFNKIYILSLADRQVCMADDNTAIFYDWREDSRAICYAKSEGGDTDEALGTLCEGTVADENGALLSQTQDDGTVVCTAQRQELAGLLYSPLTKVEYAAGGRIFFSSAKLTVPTSKLDEPEWALFSYDPVTGTLSEILPSDAEVANNDIVLFSLSPDGTKILMPNGNDRTLVYELAAKQFATIADSQSNGDDDWPDFVPSWKGNDAVCCEFRNEGTDETVVGVFNLKGELLREIKAETTP